MLGKVYLFEVIKSKTAILSKVVIEVQAAFSNWYLNNSSSDLDFILHPNWDRSSPSSTALSPLQTPKFGEFIHSRLRTKFAVHYGISWNLIRRWNSEMR